MSELDEAADATLVASRALLGVAARSVAAALEIVTLPQLRVLSLIAASGPQRSGTLADRLGVHPSTFTRTADRMVAGGWVERLDNPATRREVLIGLTPAGHGLIDAVLDRRRTEIAAILSGLSPDERGRILEGLRTFARAAGEPDPDDLLPLGG